MYIRLGFAPAIVVSSPSAAKLFLKTYDHIFANRSHHEFSYLVAYEQRNIVFGRYGPYWRNMRKLCTVQLLSGLKIRQFEPMRKAEVGSMVDSLREAAASVDLSAMIMSVNGGMTCLMVLGRKFEERDLDDRGFKGLMSEAMAGPFNLGDYYPYLRWMDPQGSARRFKKIGVIFDWFVES
ncbi:cytochrome P450 71AU50-like [Salvia splendens]|uniref:cytochrome P450 71AU50-like n=1 Tax=Salvia splendens TaxID=180675 RepID=UPI001C269393|nr:cytochrome P450 71AU50-like [Salvia splendens]XP_042042999.1 cytochrome P450 71AU50-like [Salvia splendens]XP_042045542.1 cytochrome P450 71AU50-like [Salvia splendens]